MRCTAIIMFTLLTTSLFGSDLTLISEDGKPIAGYEMADLSPKWASAKTLSPNGLGHGYPVAYYPVPDTRTGWVYDFSKSPRAIRAAYRKANNVTKAGRFTVVMWGADWCSPCRAFLKSKEPAAIKKIADFEHEDVDNGNPLGITTVPTFVVYNADAEEVARFTGAITADTIQRIID